MERRESARENEKQEEATQSLTADGSLCGFESLHRLLQSSLRLEVFQVTFFRAPILPT